MADVASHGDRELVGVRMLRLVDGRWPVKCYRLWTLPDQCLGAHIEEMVVLGRLATHSHILVEVCHDDVEHCERDTSAVQWGCASLSHGQGRLVERDT
jgi:hypothetical protein